MASIDKIQIQGTGYDIIAASATTAADYTSGGAIDTALNEKVPTSRTVNNKALSSNISLIASDVGAWGDYGYFSNGAATASRWGKVAKVHWNSAFDGYCAVRGVLEMHQYGGNVVTAQFIITFNTSYTIGYAHMYGIFSDSNLTSQVKLGATFNHNENDLVLHGYIYNHAYSGVSVSIMDVKHYKGNKPDCTITHYSNATSQSNEPGGITYCTNHGW